MTASTSASSSELWYDFLVENVSCEPLENPSRMVQYAAAMLDFEVTALACDPYERRFRAAVTGPSEALDRLAALVVGAFPEARVQLQPAAGAPS